MEPEKRSTVSRMLKKIKKKNLDTPSMGEHSVRARNGSRIKKKQKTAAIISDASNLWFIDRFVLLG